MADYSSRREYEVKLTPEIAAQIVGLIAAGMPRTYAAEKIGVHRNTIRNWLRDGEAPDPPARHAVCVAFACDFRKARAARLEKLIDKVDQLAMGLPGLDPKTAATQLNALKFLLEKEFPDAFGAAKPDVATVRLQRAKLQAELDFVHMKLAALTPKPRGTRPEPAEIDAIFEDEFGFPGAKQLPGSADDTRPEGSAHHVGGTPVPVSARVGPRKG